MWQVPAMRYALPALVVVLVVTAAVTGGTPALSPEPQSTTATQATPDAVAAPVTEWAGSVAASLRVSVWTVAVWTVAAAALGSLRTDLGWAVNAKLG